MPRKQASRVAGVVSKPSGSSSSSSGPTKSSDPASSSVLSTSTSASPATFSTSTSTSVSLHSSIIPTSSASTSSNKTDSSSLSSPPRLWEDMHIEDFQALPPVIMKNRFSPDTIAAIHTLGKEAERRGTFKHHGSDGHFKYYLQTGSFVHKINPGLVKELRTAMEEADSKHYQLLTQEPKVTVRLVEYHTYTEGGGLIGAGWEHRHFDGGSFLTMVVMLSEPGIDFEGGKLVASRTDWDTAVTEEFVEVELLHAGDCAVFPSHKYHNVTTVTKGKRHVLVMELWPDYEGFEDARPGSWGSAADPSLQENEGDSNEQEI